MARSYNVHARSTQQPGQLYGTAREHAWAPVLQLMLPPRPPIATNDGRNLAQGRGAPIRSLTDTTVLQTEFPALLEILKLG